MPMTQGYFRFNIGALIPPTLSRKFTPITVVSKFHDIIDSHAPVSVIIVIGLPNSPKAVHGCFPVISEIPSDCLKIGSILVATKDHALLVWFAFVIHLVARQINDGLPVLILDLTTTIAKVEVELAIGTEVYGVDPMIINDPEPWALTT